jgi:hypothetical protein
VISHLCVVPSVVPDVFHDVVIDHFFGCCAHGFVPALCVLKIQSPSRIRAVSVSKLVSVSSLPRHRRRPTSRFPIAADCSRRNAC